MDAAKRKLYGMKAQIIRAVAHPIRLAIVDFLKDGEQCVCDIAAHVRAQRSNVSRHLAVMLRSGVLECRKDGLRVLYRLKTPCIVNFLSCVTSALKERMAHDAAVMKAL